MRAGLRGGDDTSEPIAVPFRSRSAGLTRLAARGSRPPAVRVRRPADSCRGRAPSPRFPASASSASRVAGSPASASRSTQNTYSQARPIAGLDSSLLMFNPAAAKIPSARWSAPGSLRIAMTSVVRIGRATLVVRIGRATLVVRIAPACEEAAATSAGSSVSPGRMTTTNRVRLSGTVWMPPARTSRPKIAAARGDRTAAARRSPRSTIILPAPAVLYVVSRDQGRVRR